MRTLFRIAHLGLPRIFSYTLLVVAVVGLAAFSGCEKNGAPPVRAVYGPEVTLRIAVIPKGTSHVFWKSIEAGARRAEKDLKVEVQWKGPLVEDDRDGQRKVIESFITSNIHGIVLAPLDEHAMKGPVDQAMRVGKPVVIIDSGLKGENFVSFVATDNYKGGVLAAETLAGLIGKKGRILLMRYQIGSASTDKREQGFIDTIRKIPGIELVPPKLDQYGGATVGKAMNVAEALLSRYPELDGIFCPNESSTTAMLQALRSSGRAGKLKFVGFDSSDALVNAMKEGHIHGLVLQNPVRMGELGVRTLVKYLRGEDVERRVDTGVTVATPENMNEPEIKTLLFPEI